MLDLVHVWVIRQLTLGEFASRQAVLSKAVLMAAKIAVFAYLLNILGHLVLVAFGLLPYPLLPALVVATMLTPPVSFLVAVLAYSVVGLAIYDLGVSRQRFETLSRTDMLSGLMNRRAFLDTFEQARGPVALILLDIDRFKSINDTLGHKAGDDVITRTAKCLTEAPGAGEVIARIGGEEFAVLLRGQQTERALQIAESIRQSVESMGLAVGGRPISVTVSAGVSEGVAERGFSELFSGADRALYLAKASGRNRIVHAKQLVEASLDASFPDDAQRGAGLARLSA
ncbi:diguanylate cyclase (GGDEF)-like protein [Peteryoungia aggregata LMG 23059]|uniref:diguanylate cyclase n=1 Tax=Peteryoungia aggregata LMG 23059 TaxID=1368425 RepID=A0ABU0G7J4_9HYPH|nr:GGDEF domain-containing protein [Peteryoungia aggregata]MDQ0421305.1 diguanylate cyclase (GGDEF)-like protein [Peteryoungia aggregata LMG 23059]